MTTIEMQGALVRARHLRKTFGRTRALVDANLTVRAGQIHALLGGNGAGKSTLIKLISGVLRPDGGELAFAEGDGRSDPGMVAVVHQELAQLPDLTVAENIAIGLLRGRVRYPWAEARSRARRSLEMLGVEPSVVHPDSRARELGLHELQLVEIARAISTGARLILLDEPTASLTDRETQRLFTTLRRLAADGIGLVFVSHRMHEIRQIADVCTVLRDGETIIAGEPLSKVRDADIVQAMTASARAAPGRPAMAQEPDHATPTNSVPALVLREMAGEFTVSLAAGEVLGLAGAPTGPMAVLDSLLGLRRPSPWLASLGGSAYRPHSPRKAVRSGVGFVSGDRASKGLLPGLSIKENLLAARRVVNGPGRLAADETAVAEELLRQLDIKTNDLDDRPDRLSGGTQQKLLIARWLSLPLRLLLLEEPTRGVDIHTKREIYRLVASMASAGLTVLWWSSEHSELVEVCDRVLTFTAYGRVGRLLAGDELTEDAITAHTGLT